MCLIKGYFGQITIFPKPELRGFGGGFPYFSPPFGVTNRRERSLKKKPLNVMISKGLKKNPLLVLYKSHHKMKDIDGQTPQNPLYMAILVFCLPKLVSSIYSMNICFLKPFLQWFAYLCLLMENSRRSLPEIEKHQVTIGIDVDE